MPAQLVKVGKNNVGEGLGLTAAELVSDVFGIQSIGHAVLPVELGEQSYIEKPNLTVLPSSGILKP